MTFKDQSVKLHSQWDWALNLKIPTAKQIEQKLSYKQPGHECKSIMSAFMQKVKQATYKKYINC